MSQEFSNVILFKIAFSVPSDSEFGAAIVEVFRGENLVLGTIRVATMKSVDISGITTVWSQDPWVSYIRFIASSFGKGKIDFRTTKEFTEVLHKTFAPFVHSYLDTSSSPFESGIHSSIQNDGMELLTMHGKSNYSSVTERICASLSKGRSPDKIPLVICSSEIVNCDEYKQIKDKELGETQANVNNHSESSFAEYIVEGLPPDSVLVDCRPVVSAASGVLVYALRPGMDIMVGIPWDSRSESLIRYLAQESGMEVDPVIPFIQPGRVISTKGTSRGVVICVHLQDNFYGKLDEVEPIKVKIAPPDSYRGEKIHPSQEERSQKNKSESRNKKNHTYYEDDDTSVPQLYYWTTIGFVTSLTLGFLLAYFFLW